ncbi:unnamed protein product [Closterium sp. Yama58-4]|nr:unnamed protein product [Closterium sp. Yama58-4]
MTAAGVSSVYGVAAGTTKVCLLDNREAAPYSWRIQPRVQSSNNPRFQAVRFKAQASHAVCLNLGSSTGMSTSFKAPQKSPGGSIGLSTRPCEGRLNSNCRSGCSSSRSKGAMASAAPVANHSSRGVAASASSAAPAAAADGKSTGGPAVSEAVIVGGGLAGLALAIGLRNLGIDAQVYEARKEVGGGEGTIISLFPNGLRALNRIDPAIVPQLIPLGVTDPASFLLSPSGEVLAPWGYSATMTARFGLPMLSIRWRNVLDVLRGMLPNDAVHTGHRLVKVTQREEAGRNGEVSGAVERDGVAEGEGMVECFFSTVSCGNEHLVRVETPLLLGADGIHSEARKQLLGEGVSPRDNGRTIWRAIIDSSLCPHPLLKPRHILAMVGPGRTATISDAAAGRLYWAFTLVDSADPTVSSARSSRREEAREKILQAFKGWDVVEQLVKATPPDLILERRVLDLPPLPFWVHGRMALLGDAAHAVTPALGQGANLRLLIFCFMYLLCAPFCPPVCPDAAHAVTPALGQGANLAFEDAAQLVECLRALPHARWVLSDALHSFQSIRMPRVQAVVSQNVASSKKIYEDKDEEGTERESSNGMSTEATAGTTTAGEGGVKGGKGGGGGEGGGEGSEFYDYLYSYDTVPLDVSLGLVGS